MDRKGGPNLGIMGISGTSRSKRRKPTRSAPRPSGAWARHGGFGAPPNGGEALQVTPLSVVWEALRPVLVWLTAALVTLGILYTAWRFADNLFLAPPDAADQAMVTFEVSSGSSGTVRAVAAKLYGDPDDPNRVQLIRSKFVFQYAFEFLSQGHQIKAGTYELSRSMTITDIIGVITMGNPAPETMRIRLIEGMTIEEIADELVAQKALSDTKEFLALCKSGEAFRGEFDFIDELLAKKDLSNRRYALEGYLFPDTYEIYVNSSPEVIVRKMLRRMDEIYSINAYEQLVAQDTTLDDVLKLASMIEKEAKSADFEKVSAVFHNRLNQNMALGSDVTIKYALRVKRMALTAEDIKLDSPYNTYARKGLPPSPIANPGLTAILAALSPDEEFAAQGFLYFTSTDPESGVLAFSKTLKDHDALAAQYRPLWEAYDAKMAASPSPTPSLSPSPAASPTPSPTR